MKFRNEAQEAIINGVEKLANAVKVTMGPKGRNVIIKNGDGDPHITKDGVTVAKNVNLKDSYENIGASLLKEVALKTADEAGDGTTTATVLAQNILVGGSKKIEESGINPILFKRHFDNLTILVSDFIRGLAIPADDQKTIENVASVSANNDREIGELIAESVTKATKDGLILIEETTNSETTIEVIEGMQIEKGYVSHYFVNNQTKLTCELENPLIFLYDKKINKVRDILHILEMAASNNRAIVIIAEDYDSEMLGTLIANTLNGAIRMCALKIPGFGVNRKGIMEDIAILTGATYVKEELGMSLKDVSLEDLGSCSKFNASKDSSMIIGGMGDKEKIKERIEYLRKLLASDQPLHINDVTMERLAKLSGGVVVIKVGANSESELKEKKDRIDDALCATRAAISEGIVPGGGSTYLKAITYLENLINNPTTEEEKIALDVMIEALSSPIKTICRNSGIDDVSNIISCNKNPDNTGLDILSGDTVDMVERGIVDPAKVTRVALENAASIASLFITTDCIIIND